MKLNEWATYAEKIEGNGDTSWAIEEMLAGMDPDSDEFECAVSLIAREPYDSIGVGKATIRNLAVETLDVTEDTLKSWESDEGDLPSAVRKAANHTERIVPRREVSLEQLHEDIEAVRDASGGDGKRRIRKMLSDYEHPKWVAHSLLGEDGVSFGIGPKTIASIVGESWDIDNVSRARALTPDIVEFCSRAYKDGTVPQEAIVGRPFNPMLVKSKGVPEDVSNWMIQPKYDGARILLHVHESGDYTAYSRNRKDKTNSMPELADVVDELPDGEYILDAEVIPYKDGEQVDFRHVMTRYGREQDIEEQDIDLEFKFFDVVYADQESSYLLSGDISKYGNESRIVFLESLLAEQPEILAETYYPDSRDELMERFQSFLSRGLEGAIIKEEDSVYEFGKRSTDWRRMVNNNDNVDLKVTEVIEGEDSRSNSVGALRLETSDGHGLGKVGTGFTEKRRNELWESPDELVGKIVEVEWRDLQQNEDGTYSLRFPSFVSVRNDKDEANSLKQVKDKDNG